MYLKYCTRKYFVKDSLEPEVEISELDVLVTEWEVEAPEVLAAEVEEPEMETAEPRALDSGVLVLDALADWISSKGDIVCRPDMNLCMAS